MKINIFSSQCSSLYEGKDSHLRNKKRWEAPAGVGCYWRFVVITEDLRKGQYSTGGRIAFWEVFTIKKAKTSLKYKKVTCKKNISAKTALKRLFPVRKQRSMCPCVTRVSPDAGHLLVLQHVK